MQYETETKPEEEKLLTSKQKAITLECLIIS